MTTTFEALAGDGKVGLILDPLTALALAQLMEDADLAGTEAEWIRSLRLAANAATCTVPAPALTRSCPRLRVVGGDPV